MIFSMYAFLQMTYNEKVDMDKSVIADNAGRAKPER